MPDRSHPAYQEYLANVGRPVVTKSERLQARRLRDQGLALGEIARRMGRVQSTIFHMLREANAAGWPSASQLPARCKSR